jgi:hypothetical protein
LGAEKGRRIFEFFVLRFYLVAIGVPILSESLLSRFIALGFLPGAS